ncbi:TOMM precursor leader peptide-binding protein [Streptomyces adustus]|uniref:TOMM precursor leader peptide-binding protein n=1 Tax=Streptomyces adustus TaxID=1609272 RepID=UPI0035D7D975
MAPAIRLTGMGDPPDVAYLSRGPFGDSVVSRMAERLPGRRLDDLSDLAAEPATDLVVIALWRPARQLCWDMDDFAYEQSMAWLPVVREETAVTVGPLVVPEGPGACWHCYYRRRVTHDRQWPATHDLHTAYDEDDTCGSDGYLPQHIRTAAALALITAARRGDSAKPTPVVRLDLTSTKVTSDRVVGCHGCLRCGIEQPQSGNPLSHLGRNR